MNGRISSVTCAGITGSTSALVHPADRYVGLRPSSAYVEAGTPLQVDVIVTDLVMETETAGLDVLALARAEQPHAETIMVTAHGDIPAAKKALQGGAYDFIEKPVSREELLASVRHALEESRDEKVIVSRREKAVSQLSSLTERQRQIMDMVLDGHPSKNIAADLGISHRFFE